MLIIDIIFINMVYVYCLYIYIYGLIKQIWYTSISIAAMYIAICLYNQIIMQTLSIGLG